MSNSQMDNENKVHIHNGIPYGQKNMKFAGKWVELESITLSNLGPEMETLIFFLVYIVSKFRFYF